MSTPTLFTLLLICISVSKCDERLNSKRLQWEDRSAKIDDSQHLFPRIILGIAPRDDRKIIFINNKAYDMPEEEQSMLWHLFLHEGFVPETVEFVPQPQMDSLDAALSTPGAVIVESSSYNHLEDSDHNVLSEEHYDHESMKTSRLVGVPDEVLENDSKQQQIPSSSEVSTTESPDSTNSTNAKEPEEVETIDISDNNKMADVATVQRVSVLYYLWTKLTSLGGMLGRGVVDTLSDTIWTWWLNLLQSVKSRTSGKSLPEVLWTSWLSVLQYVNSREHGDPLPELLWKAWLTVLQSLKSRGR